MYGLVILLGLVVFGICWRLWLNDFGVVCGFALIGVCILLCCFVFEGLLVGVSITDLAGCWFMLLVVFSLLGCVVDCIVCVCCGWWFGFIYEVFAVGYFRLAGICVWVLSFACCFGGLTCYYGY